MKDAQKPDHVSLATLVGRLKGGQFVIPDFQREFEWEPWDISHLMRSIFLDYYIGSLLLWRSKKENFRALACEDIYGFTGSGNPVHIVLDGQQRLTAIYYALMAPDIRLLNRTNRFLYFIQVDRFMAEDYDQAFKYDWTQGAVKLLSDRTAQYQTHMFPLGVIGRGGWDLYEWIHGYEHFWRDVGGGVDVADDTSAQGATRHADNARIFGQHLKDITEQYQVAYIELDQELELDKVCDIFTQINSRGIRLDVFDLMNALLKPRGLQLKHLWWEARPRLEFVELGRMNVYILQVISILRQAYCSPKYLYYLLPGQEKTVRDPGGTLRREVLVPTTTEFERLWNQAVDAMAKAIDLLRHPHEFGAISSRYLPYVSILPAFTALQVEAGDLPANRQLDAQRKIRHWYWASAFTNRYSGSVESTAARDYLDVKAWFDDDLAEPAMIAEFRSRFRSLDLRRETRRGTSVYNAIFNLLIVRGARDWMTGNVPQYEEIDDHHIVPKDWGKSHQSVGSLIDSILNRTPLTSATNRNVIRDRLPNAYLPELLKSNGRGLVLAILASHFISPVSLNILLRDPFTPQDFDDFLAERQRTLQEAIENLLVKERLDLSPALRELDERIEKVELALRRTINSELRGDASQLPHHVQQKIAERLQAQAKKNPAMDLDRYATLSGKLEYCDLRELQDAVTSKLLWPVFAQAFSSKEALNSRFHQLAGLRNGLRHSRAVDEITKKDGEAAVLWFESALRNQVGS